MKSQILWYIHKRTFNSWCLSVKQIQAGDDFQTLKILWEETYRNSVVVLAIMVVNARKHIRLFHRPPHLQLRWWSDDGTTKLDSPRFPVDMLATWHCSHTPRGNASAICRGELVTDITIQVILTPEPASNTQEHHIRNCRGHLVTLSSVVALKSGLEGWYSERLGMMELDCSEDRREGQGNEGQQHH